MKKILLTLLAFAQSYFLIAQYDIQLQVIISPPYTPYLGDYMSTPNKVNLIVKNVSNTNHSLVFAFRMESSNGSKVSSKIGLAAATPFLIGANQVRTINTISSELKQYFTSSNLEFINLDNSFASLNILPEGDYSFCLIAYDKNTGVALSETSCTDISINYVDPPLIIQPICGEDINATNIQNINFLWMPPATSSQGLEYEFTLKEIPLSYNLGRGRSNNLNPNDVIKSSYYPVLFTTRVLNTALNYNFRFPKLENGKSYVWRVQAIAKNNKITLKQNGYSEACVFNYIKDSMLYRIDTSNYSTPPDQPLPTPSPEVILSKKIELVSPANKQVITWNLPQGSSSGYHEFSWKQLADTNLYYTLEIVRMKNKNELPEVAIKTGNLLGIQNNATKSSSIKLFKQLAEAGQEGASYAWRIVAYDKIIGGKKLHESDPRIFYTLPFNFGK